MDDAPVVAYRDMLMERIMSVDDERVDLDPRTYWGEPFYATEHLNRALANRLDEIADAQERREGLRWKERSQDLRDAATALRSGPAAPEKTQADVEERIPRDPPKVEIGVRVPASAPLTGDDDSVAHSWDTVPTQVWVDVDREIAPLVRALNALDGIRTMYSCQGHPHGLEPRAYVAVGWTGVEHLTTLQRSLGAFEIEWEDEGTIRNAWATLYFDHALIPEMTLVVSKTAPQVAESSALADALFEMKLLGCLYVYDAGNDTKGIKIDDLIAALRRTPASALTPRDYAVLAVIARNLANAQVPQVDGQRERYMALAEKLEAVVAGEQT